jgi:hypothetical protein
MSDQNSYNPNAAWTSKEKKYVYTPPITVSSPKKKIDDNHDHDDGHGFDHGSDGWKKTIVIVSVIVILMAAAGVAAYFFLKPAPAIAVGITFTKPDQVQIGDAFPLSVSYDNASGATLTGATLTLALPSGVYFAGGSMSQQVMEWPVGDLAPGATGSRSSTLIITGNPESVEHLSAVLTYGNADSSGKVQLTTSATADIVVGTPAVGLVITAPADVSSGQNFTVKVSYVNNAGHALDDVKMGVQYPSAAAFTFVTSTAGTDSSENNEWDLGPLAAGASGDFTITGNIVGPDNAPYSIVGTVNTVIAGEAYAVANQTANLVMAPSPLKLTVTLNGKQDYVAGLADGLDYTISYANASNVTLQNAVITAKLVGAMFDFSTLHSAGSFSSITNEITWNGANVPGLQDIAPGQSGAVDVTLRTKGSFPIRLLSDKNYFLNVSSQIVSPTVPPGTAASTTVAVANLTSKVGGLVSLSSVGYSRDPGGAITNSGPYPPKVNTPTQYTIHWRITNYSTDIANVTVSAYLQSGTTCTGQLESNVPEALPSCDPTTGQVTWTIPQIPATTGVLGSPDEAVFQVVNTPAVNQVGTDVTLLGQTTLAATDLFTSSTVSLNAPAVDTSLPQDKTKTSGVRQVTQ